MLWERSLRSFPTISSRSVSTSALSIVSLRYGARGPLSPNRYFCSAPSAVNDSSQFLIQYLIPHF